jgi:hypothetical protein
MVRKGLPRLKGAPEAGILDVMFSRPADEGIAGRNAPLKLT